MVAVDNRPSRNKGEHVAPFDQGELAADVIAVCGDRERNPLLLLPATPGWNIRDRRVFTRRAPLWRRGGYRDDGITEDSGRQPDAGCHRHRLCGLRGRPGQVRGRSLGIGGRNRQGRLAGAVAGRYGNGRHGHGQHGNGRFNRGHG